MAEGKNTPFDEDIMTLFMGIEPEEPGQHGRTQVPAPDEDAIGTLVEIKDIIEKFLLAIGKGKGNAEKPVEGKPDETEPETEPEPEKGKR